MMTHLMARDGLLGASRPYERARRLDSTIANHVHHSDPVRRGSRVPAVAQPVTVINQNLANGVIDAIAIEDLSPLMHLLQELPSALTIHGTLLSGE